MKVYKSISEYSIYKKISRNKAYRLLELWEIIKFNIWKRSYFLEKKETIKFLSSEW